VSIDVDFNEHVFPFAEQHPNAGKSLKAKILLLPTISPTQSTNRDAQYNDHTYFPIIPIVANLGQENDETDGASEADSTEQNATGNDEEMSESQQEM
jgi:hypothetical protein